MGLLDLFKGKFVDPTYPGVHAGGNVITTTLDSVVKWGRRSSIWPMPFGTACCAIEFMALTASHYDLARFGAEVLRFSPRQADLMFVAGTIADKLGPVLKTIYDQMPEPKWVISMGVCASSGGFYRSLPRHAGHRRDHPGGRLRARLPAVARRRCSRRS
jgi:NADH-quinone oxidoreductase B subunit